MSYTYTFLSLCLSEEWIFSPPVQEKEAVASPSLLKEGGENICCLHMGEKGPLVLILTFWSVNVFLPGSGEPWCPAFTTWRCFQVPRLHFLLESFSQVSLQLWINFPRLTLNPGSPICTQIYTESPKTACACSVMSDSHQHPLYGIFQARILEWLPFPPPGDLPDPGMEPASPSLQTDSLPLSHLGSPPTIIQMVYLQFRRRLVEFNIHTQKIMSEWKSVPTGS